MSDFNAKCYAVFDARIERDVGAAVVLAADVGVPDSAASGEIVRVKLDGGRVAFGYVWWWTWADLTNLDRSTIVTDEAQAEAKAIADYVREHAADYGGDADYVHADAKMEHGFSVVVFSEKSEKDDPRKSPGPGLTAAEAKELIDADGCIACANAEVIDGPEELDAWARFEAAAEKVRAISIFELVALSRAVERELENRGLAIVEVE